MWADFSFHATILLNRGATANNGRPVKSAPPNKEVVAIKINLKKLKKELSKIDWNFRLQVGTFLATLYGALK